MVYKLKMCVKGTCDDPLLGRCQIDWKAAYLLPVSWIMIHGELLRRFSPHKSPLKIMNKFFLLRKSPIFFDSWTLTSFRE